MEKTVLKANDTQTINHALVVEVMGYQVSLGLFLKDGEFPLIIREFNPLEKLTDAFKVLRSITTDQYPNRQTSYQLTSHGIGHKCLIYNDGLQRAGSSIALTLEEAICMAVLDYCDIQTDYEDTPYAELYPRKEAV